VNVELFEREQGAGYNLRNCNTLNVPMRPALKGVGTRWSQMYQQEGIYNLRSFVENDIWKSFYTDDCYSM